MKLIVIDTDGGEYKNYREIKCLKDLVKQVEKKQRPVIHGITITFSNGGYIKYLKK